MTVIAMDSAPESVRGELTRWFLELKPGVFVGRVNSRIRDLLWKRICETDSAAGAVMVFSAPNEQGFEMKVSGDPKRRVIDFEGIQLITVSEEAHRNTEIEELIGAQEEAKQIRKILHELPDPYKEVFMWRVFGELSFKAIGELYNKTDNWACVTYHRARKMMQHRFGGNQS